MQPKAQFKQCTSCCATLPLASYTQNKYGRHGRDNACSECRKQALRLRRKNLYKAVSKIDDSLIRNVKHHNTNLIQMALSQKVCTLIGFVPHTDKVYKVVFGKSRYDMPSMAIFNNDGSNYIEVAYSGVKPDLVMDHLINALKTHEIRLELSEVQMMTSKNVIYWV